MRKLSSYQRLKLKKAAAEKIASDKIEDLEAVVLYPYSKRAKAVRMRIKLENE